jgi:hypothetical protein
VDTFSRYGPVLDPRFSHRAQNVVRALDDACAHVGYLKTIRVDNVLRAEGNGADGQSLSVRQHALAA